MLLGRCGGGMQQADRPLTKTTQLIWVLSRPCTTLPSLWFGCDPLSKPSAPAAGHRHATLTGLSSVPGAELNEGNGLRRVRSFWFSLFMA